MKRWQVIVISLIICLPALWPMFQPQFFHLHDWTHVARLVEMDQALKDGHFPVRWSKDLGYGYGLPQFNFYAPLFYYLAEVFYLLGMGAIWSVKTVVMLNYWVSFIAMYYLGAKVFNRYVGLVAATAFIYIPYRAVDTYVRGSFAELTAITFLAITLTLFSYWAHKPSYRQVAIIALAWSGIFLAHNLTGVISFPFLILTSLGLVAIKKQKIGLLGQITGMVVLTLGLASFYLLPMIAENKFTMAENLTTGFSDFRQHFLYLRQFISSVWGYGGSIYGTDDDISFRIGNLQLALAGVTALMTMIGFRKFTKIRLSLIITSFLVIVSAILLSTFKTQFIWEAISYMKYIQFPWRFLAVIIVYISFLAGSAVFWLKDSSGTRQRWATIIISLGLIALNLAYFRPEEYLKDNQTLYFTDKIKIATQMSPVIPDFISRYDTLVTELPKKRVEANPDNKDMVIEVDRTAEFLVSLPVVTPTIVNINILYFPGWKVYVNGQEVAVTVKPLWPTMQISVLPSPGQVYISGIFTETPIRKMGNAITVISLLVVAFLIIREPDKKNYGSN